MLASELVIADAIHGTVVGERLTSIGQRPATKEVPMSDKPAPPVRCTERMGETEAALAKRNGPPVCRHGEMLVQAEKTMSYERRWCVTGGGRWWVCPAGDHGCGSMLEPGSASRDLSSRREPSLSPIDPKLSDGGAWRGSCVVERNEGIRTRKKGGSE